MKPEGEVLCLQFVLLAVVLRELLFLFMCWNTISRKTRTICHPISYIISNPGIVSSE